MSYKVLHLSHKIILANLTLCSKMRPFSGNPRPGLLASRMNMSLTRRPPRDIHDPQTPQACQCFWNCHKALVFCSFLASLARCTLPCACHTNRTRLSEPTCRPSGATNPRKNDMVCNIATSSRKCIFFLLTLSPRVFFFLCFGSPLISSLLFLLFPLLLFHVSIALGNWVQKPVLILCGRRGTRMLTYSALGKENPVWNSSSMLINVCICTYVCMYVCMYLCIYVSMYLCIYVSMYLCMYLCTYARMHACMHLWMCAWMHVCMCACLHVCMYVCMYVFMYVCMYLAM